MSFENVNTLFIHCPNKNNNLTILLESAIFWAEQEVGVWVITTEYIQSLPTEWTKIPEQCVSKFMTFLFLPSINDLFEKIVNVQFWSITPKIILVSHLDRYFENEDISIAAQCCAILIDAINICARKLNESTYLAVTFATENKKLLQCLINLYFYKNVFIINENNFCNVLKDIKKIYSSC